MPAESVTATTAETSVAVRVVRRGARFWPAPFLALLAWAMFRFRMGSYGLNVRGDRFYYMGTDPYYHLRAVLASVENFPRALRWDPWTHFPRGTFTGQFGTLFDQVLAGVLLVAHGGDKVAAAAAAPAWLAVYPAVIGALCVVPVYFLARRMFGDPGAAYAAVLLALIPGSFFSRSVAAHADHHVAETLTSTIAVLGVLAAVERARAAEAMLGAWRQASRRDLAALAGWGALGALGLAVYLWTWPPGVLFVAILTASFALLAALDHARGRTSRGTAFGAGVAFVGAALLVLPLRETDGFEVTFYTWTQPLTLVLGAAFLALLAWASERFARRLPRHAFLGAAVGAGAVAVVLLALVSPTFFGVLKGGFEWVTGIGYEGGGRTIAEARPTELQDMEREYGALFWGAMVGLVVLLVGAVRRPGPSNVLLLVWSAFMTMAAFNQVRFNYYLAVNVALLNGYLLAEAARVTRLDEAWRNTWSPPPAPKGRKALAVEKLGWKQPAALAAVVLFVVPGNVLVEEGALECGRADYRPAWALAKCLGPDREVQFWTDGLLWLRDHTPDPGFRVGDLHDPETFEYPPEAYGVLSWWDYGHYTEVLGERAPVANPFQQAAPLASRYFTAATEAEANAILDAWSPERPIRYVLVDDATASTKFYAITVWAGLDGEYAAATKPMRLPEGEVDVPTLGPRFEDAMVNRLYRDDAEDLDHYRLVHEERATSLLGHMVSARDGDVRLASFNDILDWGDPESMDRTYGLNYRSDRIVCAGASSPDDTCPSKRYGYDLEVHSALKVFERVEGAVLVGQAEPGENVTAFLELTAKNTGRLVQLERSAVAGPDGTYRIRVAQPTTGLLGVEGGGTDADVVANGPWYVALGDVRSPRAVHEAHVPERAVLEGHEVRAVA